MVNLIGKELIQSKDKFVILKNGTYYSGNGPKTLDIEKSGSLKIIHLIDKDTVINIKISAEIRVCLKEIFYNVINNPKIDIAINIGAGAQVNYISFKQNQNADNFGFITNTFLEENAYIDNKNLSVFSSKGNLIDNVYLKTPDSKVDMKNVIINVSGEKQTFQYDIYHQKEATVSTMNNYAISKNNSLLDIKSNGIIEKKAKQAQLHQKTKGLIVDEYSIIEADPILKIKEFDCIAGHGASIGAINEDELYYMMSRGLSQEEAEKLIIAGFINPFFVGIDEDKSIDFMKLMVEKNL